VSWKSENCEESKESEKVEVVPEVEVNRLSETCCVERAVCTAWDT